MNDAGNKLASSKTKFQISGKLDNGQSGIATETTPTACIPTLTSRYHIGSTSADRCTRSFVAGAFWQVEGFITAQTGEKILAAIAEGIYTFAAGAVQCLDDERVWRCMCETSCCCMYCAPILQVKFKIFRQNTTVISTI